MPLSLDAITRYNGSGRVLIDAQTGAVESAGILQRLKNFFHVGDARERNEATISAFQQAVFVKYSGTSDLWDEAMDRVGRLRAGRSVDIGELKKIVLEMDALAANTEAAAKTRIAGRVAMQMPQWARGFEKEFLAYAEKSVLASRGNGSYTGIDVDNQLQACLRHVEWARGLLSPDSSAKGLFFAKLADIVDEPDGSRSDDVTIEARVAALETQADAVNAVSGGSPEVRGAAERLVLGVRLPFDGTLVRDADAFALSVPADRLASLGPGSSAGEIFQALRSFARSAALDRFAWPAAVPPFADAGDRAALQRFVVERAVLALPPDARERLLAALESGEGKRAFDFMSSQLPAAGAARDAAAAGWIRSLLSGRPSAAPSDPALAVDLSPSARCAYDPARAFSGPNADALRTALLGPIGNPSADALHARTDATVKHMAGCVFAAEMKKLATPGGRPQFDRDVTRLVDIRLPDGSALPRDPAKARDEIARMVTGRPRVSYASLEAKERRKADAFLALLTQETEKAVENGVAHALSPRLDKDAFFKIEDGNAPQRVRTFRISGSPDRGFSIHWEGSYPTAFVGFDNPDGTPRQIAARSGSSVVFEAEIRLSRTLLDRISDQDWSEYDGTVSDRILHDASRQDPASEAWLAVPGRFRIDPEVAASFHFDV